MRYSNPSIRTAGLTCSFQVKSILKHARQSVFFIQAMKRDTHEFVVQELHYEPNHLDQSAELASEDHRRDEPLEIRSPAMAYQPLWSVDISSARMLFKYDESSQQFTWRRQRPDDSYDRSLRKLKTEWTRPLP